MLEDFISLIYPQLCHGCGKSLYKHETSICTSCRYLMPRTRFHDQPDNRVAKLFWGKVNVEAATALYYFRKGGKVQRLIHQLKYKGKTDIGQTLGGFFGEELKEYAPFDSVDHIIPVPLHPRKKRKRGYNQSDFIAEGMAQAMGINFLPNAMYRSVATASQTRKSQYERFRNVDAIFKLNPKSALAGKHLLVVDDVVTTGSTLEACATALLHLPETKVSIATLACTE